MVVEGINYKLVIRELSNWEPNIVCNKEVLDRGITNISGDTDDEALEYEVNESNYTLIGNNQQKDGAFIDYFPIRKEVNEDRGACFVNRKGGFFQTSGLKSNVLVGDDNHFSSSNLVVANSPSTTAASFWVTTVHLVSGVSMVQN
ncbi:unnamed protein product [Lactuca saligna]|uniref:Uncharacterized protein n=1 Tax=Lactuca saligna TaxID=75948 RepID=A0AA36DZX4_LACSI|nr:unnamed protein product [Lactuca saligna]